MVTVPMGVQDEFKFPFTQLLQGRFNLVSERRVLIVHDQNQWVHDALEARWLSTNGTAALNRTVNVVPSPRPLRRDTVPPIASVNRFTRASPTPVPGYSRVELPST